MCMVELMATKQVGGMDERWVGGPSEWRFYLKHIHRILAGGRLGSPDITSRSGDRNLVRSHSNQEARVLANDSAQFLLELDSWRHAQDQDFSSQRICVIWSGSGSLPGQASAAASSTWRLTSCSVRVAFIFSESRWNSAFPFMWMNTSNRILFLWVFQQ